MSRAPVPGTSHSLGLAIGPTAVQVHLGGDIILASSPDLERLMSSLDLLAYVAIDIDMTAVTFLDNDGVQPLVAAARRRQQDHLPPVRIGKCSLQARLYLHLSGLQGRPHLDLQAWDQIALSPGNKLGVAPLAEDDTEAAPRSALPSSGTGAAVPSPPNQDAELLLSKPVVRGGWSHGN
jgi:anti-anti-sigma regulatory factor